MVILSVLRVAQTGLCRASRIPLLAKIAQEPLKSNLGQCVRWMGGHKRVMEITPSRFEWTKFKDMMHYYIMLGLLPGIGVVAYCNLFIGRAELTDIPDGYEPKQWEYFQHPITRFIAKNFLWDPQQEYEMHMHNLYVDEEKKRMKQLEKKVRGLQAARNDYRGWYYIPMNDRYLGVSIKDKEIMQQQEGYSG